MFKLSIILIYSLLSNNLYSDTTLPNSFFNQEKKITIDERDQATNHLIDLLKDTNYFDFINSRIHGIPENNSTNSFWWGSMWTGVKVSKLNGVVTYTHQDNGSDNIGIHSAPYLEGACYAYLLTGDKKYAALSRKLIRGFSSWILSGVKSNQKNQIILSRSFYPASFSTNEEDRNLVVNYEASRPGKYNGVADYVHIANNPYFGELWLKNNRSIDDIGHMMRAIAHVQSCRNKFDKETKTDLEQMNKLYIGWASSVVENNYIIPTYTKEGDIIIPKSSIGDYNLYDIAGFNPNCSGKLALSLLARNYNSNLNCHNGLSNLEKILGSRLNNDAIEILRSHHISAIAMADNLQMNKTGDELRLGLVKRSEGDMAVVKNPKKFPKFDLQDIPTFFVNAYNVGAPLTPDQVRFVYDRLSIAYEKMRSADYKNTFNLFKDSVPDGSYSYDAPNEGLYFYTLAMMLGTCTNKVDLKNPIFNCELLQKKFSNHSF